MTIAALDLGRRRIGVAVTDAASMGAHPVGIVERRALKKDVAAIAAMLRDRRVSTIVVGLPLNMDGSEGPAALSARKFAASIADVLGVAVEMFDERLTSFEARERLGTCRPGKARARPGSTRLRRWSSSKAGCRRIRRKSRAAAADEKSRREIYPRIR